MELLKHADFDFLGRKWTFIGLSLVLTAAGIASWVAKGGLRYGIDFTGGANVTVLFSGKPHIDRIRSAISAKIPGEIAVQEIEGSNGVIIGTGLKSDADLQQARRLMGEALTQAFGQGGGKLDFNNTTSAALSEKLRDPLARAGAGLSDQQIQELSTALMNFRNRERSGLLRSFDELSRVAGATPQVLGVLKQECYLAPFTIRGAEVVGPKIGAELRNKAVLATLYALGGMLVYIAFRFEWIYGLAAVIAVFHDVIITLGFFSLFDKEITLNVIAALLTLVGYSMNDTIVVFDRIRETLKSSRREAFTKIVNDSINQTLSRTVLTSGLTLISALALLLFGGPVLNGFSFALVVGIVIGTYSSIFIASPLLVFCHDLIESRRRSPALAAEGGKKKG